MRLRGFEPISEYLAKNISLPVRQTKQSAGYDLAVAEDTVLLSKQVTLVPTGLKAYMQSDEYLGIHIRSSIAIKQQLSLINSQGIIDADYYNNTANEGHILIAIYNHSPEAVQIPQGTRVAQGVFYKFLAADNDAADGSVRKGGFGSTGRE